MSLCPLVSLPETQLVPSLPGVGWDDHVPELAVSSGAGLDLTPEALTTTSKAKCKTKGERVFLN